VKVLCRDEINRLGCPDGEPQQERQKRRLAAGRMNETAILANLLRDFFEENPEAKANQNQKCLN
jgi:hypothetical protein